MFDVTIIRPDCGPKGAHYHFETPQGTLRFKDKGDEMHASGYSYGVIFSYQGQELLFSYNGQGSITFVFNDEGDLSVQNGDNGIITPVP